VLPLLPLLPLLLFAPPRRGLRAADGICECICGCIRVRFCCVRAHRWRRQKDKLKNERAVRAAIDTLFSPPLFWILSLSFVNSNFSDEFSFVSSSTYSEFFNWHSSTSFHCRFAVASIGHAGCLPFVPHTV
jgi:hypothetical protein